MSGSQSGWRVYSPSPRANALERFIRTRESARGRTNRASGSAQLAVRARAARPNNLIYEQTVINPTAGLPCYTFNNISSIITGENLIELRTAYVISRYTRYIYSRKGIIKPKGLLHQRFLNISSISPDQQGLSISCPLKIAKGSAFC